MYTVTFYLPVHYEGDGAYLWVEREVAVPFVPTAGMRFASIFEELDCWEADYVSYDLGDGKFTVHFPDGRDEKRYTGELSEGDLVGWLAFGCTVDGYATLEEWKAECPGKATRLEKRAPTC